MYTISHQLGEVWELCLDALRHVTDVGEGEHPGDDEGGPEGKREQTDGEAAPHDVHQAADQTANLYFLSIPGC